MLIQVDLAGEATKFGATLDEAERLVAAALEARSLTLAGLMLLPPWNEDQDRRGRRSSGCVSFVRDCSRAARRHGVAAPVDGHEPRFRGRGGRGVHGWSAWARRSSGDDKRGSDGRANSGKHVGCNAGSPPPERVMRIAPLDLRQQRFRTVLRGFDKTEVVAFLTEAADDYEYACAIRSAPAGSGPHRGAR